MSDDVPLPSEFESEIASGDRRRSLTALRSLLAHELAGNRCRTCQMSQMRTGDLAALALRLEKVIDALDALPSDEGEVTKVDELRAKRAARESNPSDPAHLLGSRSAQRRSGSNRTGGKRGPAS